MLFVACRSPRGLPKTSRGMQAMLKYEELKKAARVSLTGSGRFCLSKKISKPHDNSGNIPRTYRFFFGFFFGSIAARGTEQEGRQGSRSFGAPWRPWTSTHRFRNLGSRKPLPRGPLEARKGSQGLGEGSSGASEKCVRFKGAGKEGGPLRDP